MDVLQPLLTAQLLVLDDVGKEKTSEWVEETMTFIVNTRYNQRLTTIFTTNYEDNPDLEALDSLRVRVGSRVYSRMHEMCDFYDYGGADYRLLPPNGGVDDLTALWKVTGEQRGRLPVRTKGPVRRRSQTDREGRPGLDRRQSRELNESPIANRQSALRHSAIGTPHWNRHSALSDRQC